MDATIPDVIQHLDFDLDESQKTCHMPFATHPITHETVRCGAPAVYLIGWHNLKKCDCMPRTWVCEPCKQAILQAKIKSLDCRAHRHPFDPLACLRFIERLAK